MLTILLPPEVRRTMDAACQRSGLRETGGMLFGEHVGDDEFRVLEITVAGEGSFARFVRELGDALLRLERFFRRTRHDYRRFNYLGEWHSHPSFALLPSGMDDQSMLEIVCDPSTGARFAVSLIVKREDERLRAQAFAYFPNGMRENCQVVEEEK